VTRSRSIARGREIRTTLKGGEIESESLIFTQSHALVSIAKVVI